MEIEQRYVISFLYRCGLKAQEIEEKLEETYQLNSYKIDAIRYWIREIKLGRTDLHNDAPRGKTADPAITTAIQAQIENNPMASARQISRTLNISPTTVIDKLNNELHYHCYLTRWIPHTLNDQQRKNRVDIANQMLDILRKEQRTHFQNIYTGDESWFLFEYNQRSQWVLSKEDLLTKTRKTNMQRKIMLTVFFNGYGHVIADFLPKGMKFNGSYFINILSQINNEVYPQGRPAHAPRKILYYNNSPCHTSNKVKSFLANSDFRTLKHPAFSPDVSPPDFGIFGTVKQKLIGIVHEDEESLQDHINEILSSFDIEFWQSIFQSWIKRLEKLIEVDGDYFE